MVYDVVIIGAGPAGLSASVFCLRAGLKVVCIEKLAVGGQATQTALVDNYLGLGLISGFDLADKFLQHATSLGAEIVYGTVTSLKKNKQGFVVQTNTQKFEAKKVIIACGCNVRKLGLDGEDRLTGRGISYCASCDGNFYKNKVVGVVGGGKTALEDVVYLSKIAKKIYLINRRTIFRAGENELNKVKKLKNVEIIAPAVVSSLEGEEVLSGVTLNCAGETKKIKLDGLFVAIGSYPSLDFVDFKLEMDEQGYIKTDANMQTSVKNLFAAGDIVSKNFRQIINACSEGATAANACIGG